MHYEKKYLENRVHFVVPVVLILADQVMNGSHGPTIYPQDELERTQHLWNAKPIVNFHPAFGSGIAGVPEIFNEQRVGFLFNVRMIGPKLVGDAWIDVERANQVDQRIVNAILDNRMLEVSTGLITDQFPDRGMFNGKEYDFVARNYHPDHLALLPGNTVGACSIAEGCGLIRNESMELVA